MLAYLHLHANHNLVARIRPTRIPISIWLHEEAWNVVVSLSIIKIVWFTNPKTICSTMDFSCGRAPACFMNCHVEECSSDLRVGLRQASHVEECRGCPAG
ncbi:hypothetical protein PRUPE_1G380100 [Prunus persica]|uniref:Uncharacterized protein n=1 Tax=Prunus persica TaxID=3760 RepID=A0A251R9L9_PRUPE|nr:hypothetical protein PRUPE_1G380100 [Prunus persica]